MRQKPAVIQDIQETFHLSNTERNFLLTAAVGEGILLMDDEHSELKIVASDEEHKQITTKPDEILVNNVKQTLIKKKQIKPKRNVAIKAPPKQRSHRVKVDSDKRFFRHRDLSLDDLKYLVAKGYKEIKCLNIKGKKERYLIKPRSNEGDEHFFLTFDIAEYLKSITNKVELYGSVKPDIIFEIKGKKYAVEVETGKLLTHNKKQLLNKVRILNKEFGKNWFFVVTNRKFYPSYIKFGRTYTKKSIFNQLNKLLNKK